MRPIHIKRNVITASIALILMPVAASANTAAAQNWFIAAVGSGATEAAAQAACEQSWDSSFEDKVNSGAITCPVGSSPIPGNEEMDCYPTKTGWGCDCTATVTCQPYY